MEDNTQATVDTNSKRFSNCSSSGASEDFDFGQWDGVDGATSVDGESIYQEEEEDDNGVPNTEDGYQPTNRAGEANTEIAAMIQRREEALSSAALSKRAERILANAKKRLTVSAGCFGLVRTVLIHWRCRAWKTTSPGLAIL